MIWGDHRSGSGLLLTVRTRTTLFGPRATRFCPVLGHKPSQVPGTARCCRTPKSNPLDYLFPDFWCSEMSPCGAPKQAAPEEWIETSARRQATDAPSWRTGLLLEYPRGLRRAWSAVLWRLSPTNLVSSVLLTRPQGCKQRPNNTDLVPSPKA